MIEVELSKIIIDEEKKEQIIVLKDRSGEKVLPIVIGLNEAAAIGAVALNKIPNVVVTLREGARALDPDLDEMARAYRMTPWSKFRNVTLPQLQPYFAAASRSGIALIWKIVLVVELLGRPNGVGFELQLNFQLFNVTAILGYTLAFVAVMLAIEYLLVQPLVQKHTNYCLLEYDQRF